ncbi:hypothetical protein [Falsiroseomonas selenitidurans]|uniref:Uncharacterized protein n=1 Tax=Falsiroseomonas selenitidurans TaxID=2716335 RepID=A0ABX1EC80_9PROT|nr:hypothetical protein [Falsiroseomonas selenitidurans]NKC33368.1 hypothetical protein [Falsiroseomonas selenitidurans]
MTTETHNPNDQRALLGLRPPADLAEGSGSLRVNTAPSAAPQAATPARPQYPVISSGWDSEEKSSKTSDLMTAVRAGLVLLVVMVSIGFLLR